MKKNFNEPIEIAEGIYWVGYYDEKDALHCNPYLIIEGNEAVLIDGGSRPDFSSVMLKVLQTGLDPKMISKLIYQHYDPDLCSSIPHLESIINNPDLEIISQRENNIFIKYYSVSSPRKCIETMNFEFSFRTGRKLRFIKTPYAHSAGSFVTFDERTRTLFSSDLFGFYGQDWDLFLELEEKCKKCNLAEVIDEKCPFKNLHCPLKRLVNFHQRIMTSSKALQYAIDQIKDLPIKIIAPQHGSLIAIGKDIEFLKNLLYKQSNIGIDNYIQ